MKTNNLTQEEKDEQTKCSIIREITGIEQKIQTLEQNLRNAFKKRNAKRNVTSTAGY